ncbi:MAG: Fic family protein [Anaerolineae bacterium]|nr:Fic family protein [Anaerolineae bacterium]
MNLIDVINKADQLKAEIDALRPISSEQEMRIIQKFRLDWNYHSNAIEGNTLSLGETRAFLLHGVTAKGKPFRDYLDIKGHNEAITYLEDFVNGQQPLTEAHLREIHTILMVEPYEVKAITPDGLQTRRKIIPGQYKTMPNHVRTSTGAFHYYATPEETPAKMGDLMQWYRRSQEKGDLHPLILAGTFHYRFVSIHPFDDGNGRMARLLMNLILMQAGYVPVIIRIATREEYLLALEEADVGELEEFITLIGEELIQSLDLYVRGARGESIEELDDIDKKIALLQRRLEIEQFSHGVEKNPKAQERLFNEVFRPLLAKVFARFSKFEKFFNQSECLAFYTIGGQRHPIRSQKPSALLEKLSDMSKSVLDGIEVRYDLFNFLKNTNYYIYFSISLAFGESEFTISCNWHDSTHQPRYQVLTNGPYDRIYTDEELSEIAFPIIEQIYTLIETQANITQTNS